MINITPIPALDSNYFWVIQTDLNQPFVYLLDPGAASPIIAHLAQHQLIPKAILITHRHRDHTDGINDLLRQWPIPVYGPDSPAIPQVTHKLYDGDRLSLAGLQLEVIAVPGHTTEHIAFYLAESIDAASMLNDPPALFCGDALFAAGCGRMFDGPADVMWDSLCKLAALPDETRVYCAHEYTLANLAFAHTVEPNNTDIAQRYEQISHLRATNGISLPSTIALEKRTNPFLRCQATAVRHFVEQWSGRVMSSSTEVFALLRQAKDNWHP